MLFNLINAFVINLTIIVAVTLGLYFFSLTTSLKNDDVDSEFLIEPSNIIMSKSAEILSGIFIGLMAFVISNHGIPIGDFRPVDVRYLPVYFSVYYGSPLIGTFTALTLMLSKCADYALNGGTTNEFMNNIFITLLILLISILIYKKGFEPKKAIFLCLGLTLVIRSIFFGIVFYGNFDSSVLIQIIINFTIFSGLFLFTGWLIQKAISISQGIHIYRTSAVFDSLTGLYNKESFYFFLDLAYNEAIYEGRHFSLAIIDFDDFKKINDSYGHLTGDEVLVEVATILKNNLDPDSRIRVCRIGGDEFAIIFKHEKYNSTEFFETVLKQIDSMSVNQSLQKKVTLSVGLIDFKPVFKEDTQYNSQSVQDLFHLADDALYAAKEKGKNQVEQRDVTIQIIEKNR